MADRRTPKTAQNKQSATSRGLQIGKNFKREELKQFSDANKFQSSQPNNHKDQSDDQTSSIKSESDHDNGKIEDQPYKAAINSQKPVIKQAQNFTRRLTSIKYGNATRVIPLRAEHLPIIQTSKSKTRHSTSHSKEHSFATDNSNIRVHQVRSIVEVDQYADSKLILDPYVIHSTKANGRRSKVKTPSHFSANAHLLRGKTTESTKANTRKFSVEMGTAPVVISQTTKDQTVLDEASPTIVSLLSKKTPAYQSNQTPNKSGQANDLRQVEFMSCIQKQKVDHPSDQPLNLRDFSIGIQIGAGSFAVVKRAIHKSSQFTCAIKTYEKRHLKDTSAQEALHKEILTLSQLDHPNIMALYEVIDNRMNVNLVMEMCNGKSLYHYIKKKPSLKLPEEECKVIFKQIVEAVSYLHQNNIVHRDLKLDNILIDERKRIKIIDFGFSIQATSDQKLNLFCGTPQYMDPDIARKKEYNGHASDVWALGVILFILVTGKLPFFGEFEGDLFRKIQNAKYQLPKELSKEIKNLLKKIFQIEPSQRVTARQLLQDEWIRSAKQ